MWIKKLILILLLCSVVLGAWGTLEDFTTYTEVDENGEITVAANTITMAGTFQPKTEFAYVYDDKGVNHFSGDFTHRLKVNATTLGLGASTSVYSLANAIGDCKDRRDAGEDGIHIWIGNWSGATRMYLVLDENGSSPSNDYGAISTGTDYYLTIDRDDDGGVNSTGRYTLYICTTNYYGEAGASLVDTLICDSSAGEQNDFRYVYGLASYDDGGDTSAIAGTIKDLDLGEAAAGGGGGGQVIIIEEE
jgi:hypothetical protein